MTPFLEGIVDDLLSRKDDEQPVSGDLRDKLRHLMKDSILILLK